jgi:hypothetical protein
VGREGGKKSRKGRWEVKREGKEGREGRMESGKGRDGHDLHRLSAKGFL